jgi:thioredoxin-like negative regulator of GroEL
MEEAMQYEVRTMPDGVYVVVADGKTVTQHNSYTDAQRVSDHMNRLAEHKQKQSLLYSTELESEE